VNVTATEAITKEIRVDATPDTAFAVFVERIGEWWPLGRYSIYGADATVAFEDDRIVERAPSGDESVWGEVLELEASTRVRFTWHPGRPEDEEPTEVELTFVADGDGTLVTLVHTGWERVGEERRASRTDYDNGWPGVLELYRQNATTVAPIRRELQVNASPETAFRVFTDDIASWWPLAKYGVFGEEAGTIVFEARLGGRVYERADDGRESEWGEVLEFEESRRFVMTWHPGVPPNQQTELEVTFSAAGTGTRVELEHRGWEHCGEGAVAMRQRYAGGWQEVLETFRSAAA
jgi:uncharacterized protein YndB with AHSA1/START domain